MPGGPPGFMRGYEGTETFAEWRRLQKESVAACANTYEQDRQPMNKSPSPRPYAHDYHSHLGSYWAQHFLGAPKRDSSPAKKSRSQDRSSPNRRGSQPSQSPRNANGDAQGARRYRTHAAAGSPAVDTQEVVDVLARSSPSRSKDLANQLAARGPELSWRQQQCAAAVDPRVHAGAARSAIKRRSKKEPRSIDDISDSASTVTQSSCGYLLMSQGDTHDLMDKLESSKAAHWFRQQTVSAPVTPQHTPRMRNREVVEPPSDANFRYRQDAAPRTSRSPHSRTIHPNSLVPESQSAPSTPQTTPRECRGPTVPGFSRPAGRALWQDWTREKQLELLQRMKDVRNMNVPPSPKTKTRTLEEKGALYFDPSPPASALGPVQGFEDEARRVLREARTRRHEDSEIRPTTPRHEDPGMRFADFPSAQAAQKAKHIPQSRAQEMMEAMYERGKLDKATDALRSPRNLEGKTRDVHKVNQMNPSDLTPSHQKAPWCVHSSRSSAQQFAERLLTAQAAPSATMATKSPKFQNREVRDHRQSATKSPKVQTRAVYGEDCYYSPEVQTREVNGEDIHSGRDPWNKIGDMYAADEANAQARDFFPAQSPRVDMRDLYDQPASFQTRNTYHARGAAFDQESRDSTAPGGASPRVYAQYDGFHPYFTTERNAYTKEPNAYTNMRESQEAPYHPSPSAFIPKAYSREAASAIYPEAENVSAFGFPMSPRRIVDPTPGYHPGYSRNHVGGRYMTQNHVF